MMEVKQRQASQASQAYREHVRMSDVLPVLLAECSAITDYRTMRDSFPRRLAHLLKCRCVLLYQQSGGTLQFAAGSFDDQPGWSAALLSVAHINPIEVTGDEPEACAWREQHAVSVPPFNPTLIAVPLIYRQRSIGVLVALRSQSEKKSSYPPFWVSDEIEALEAIAGVVALLLENTRLLERDRERIQELSLLNSISSQMNGAFYDVERLQGIVVQRVREISAADVCEFISFSEGNEAISWITPSLREKLMQRFHEQHSALPLIIERPGDVNNPLLTEYLNQLPATIKTFFAVPLLKSRTASSRGKRPARGSGISTGKASELNVLGVVVGAYSRPWKLRREEIVLLQVLAGQASGVLENMRLVAEVTEARNEARKLLRQVLEDQRLKELILESIPSGLLTVDMAGSITTFNGAAEAILGYQSSEVLGHNLSSLLKLDASSSVRDGQLLPLHSGSSPLRQNALHEVLATGEDQYGTVITADQHGREVVLDIEIMALCDNVGRQIGALATFVDVTSVHRLEEEKRRLDRLASLGEMAANVAHEVRNPLASIKTSMQMLMDDLSDDEWNVAQDALEDSEVYSANGPAASDTKMAWAQESVSVVLKEVERLDTIVHDLLLFAKPRQLHCVTCDLIALSDHVLQLMQKQCAEAHVLVQRAYESVPSVWADMAQMEQVLFNLYMNALQAMPVGGVLTVSCRLRTEEKSVSGTGRRKAINAHPHNLPSGSPSIPQQSKRQEQSVQQWFELAIADTGVGIAANQLERIFQPFFTTKAHGIGLGLPITKRLIEDHGGSLRVESHPGNGTTISVLLPVLEDVSVHDDEEEPNEHLY